MTDHYPPPPAGRDPFAGVDPEVWEILAAQQADTPQARTGSSGGPGPGGAGATGAAASDPGSAGGAPVIVPAARGPAGGAGIAMLVVLVAGALLDPSGLAAPIAWNGAQPTAAPWSWLQYLLYGPAVVLGLWWSTRRLLRAATPAAPRMWVLSRVWLLVVLVTMAAKAVYSAIWMAPALLGGADQGLPWATSLPYLVWSTGFAGIKALLLGWIPGLVAALAWRRAAAVRAGVDERVAEPTLALLPAAAATAVIALLGAWLAGLWWTGSPVGYAHPDDWRLLAPIPTSGRASQVAALVLVWLLMAASIRATLLRVAVPRPRSVQLLAGAGAAVAAGLGLALVQSVVALLLGTSVPGGDDLWILPSTFLRLVEGLSFGLLAAPVTALAAWLVPRVPRPGWSPVAVVAALVVLVGSLVLVDRRPGPIPQLPALAGSDPAPVDLSAQPIAEVGVPAPPGRITVRRDADGSAVLADQSGAQVILRGVNVNQLVDYYAADPQVATVIPLAEQDFADIAALGFNVVRLALSWSALEPEPGRIDEAYLGEVRQAVAWAGTHGIHIVLDMHQDAWGKDVVAPPNTQCRAGTAPMTGWDGAPGWASHFDAAPPCQFTGRDLAPNVLRAFTSLYTNRDGIEDRLVEAWRRLASEFGGDPTVAGYDLLNEPSFAEQAPLTSGMLLGRYHARAIRAIREGEAQAANGYPHPIFLEPSIWWSGFGVDPLPPRGFAVDSQLVFAPHQYQESITVDQSVGLTTVGIERGYALAHRAAARWGVPLWIGEWGSFGDPATTTGHHQRVAAVEDALRIGSAAWVWKQACGDPHAYPSAQTGNIRRVSCPDNAPLPSQPEVLAPLTRAYPRSAPGRILSLRAQGRSLELDGSTSGAGAVDGTPGSCTLDVWVPGTAEPAVGDSTGIRELRAVSVPAGSPEQAPSGGWRVIGCASGTYRLALS